MNRSGHWREEGELDNPSLLTQQEGDYARQPARVARRQRCNVAGLTRAGRLVSHSPAVRPIHRKEHVA